MLDNNDQQESSVASEDGATNNCDAEIVPPGTK